MSKPMISNVRRTTVRAFSLGIICGGFLTAGTIAAFPAKADTDSMVFAYAATYGSAVCSTLDSYPSFEGILGIGQSIIEDGMTGYQAGEVIGVSVIEICPRHMGLLNAFVNSNSMAAA